jgi:hypothetical protein
VVRRFDVAFFIAGIFIIAALAYAGATAPRPHQSVASTYDTGRNGYRALYEVLQGAGVPVSRFESELPLLGSSVRTLVLTGYEDDPSAKPLDEHDAEALHGFVARGGRFVAIDSEFAGSEDVTPGVGTTVRAPGGREAIPLARNAYTAGVPNVRGAIDWTFPFKERRGIPLLANSSGMVAISYPFGRGEVIAITAPNLFDNATLRNAGNLRFAYNVIAGHGNVAFDEYAHGYTETPSLWSVLPVPVRAAVWTVVAIAVIALVGANVPFAPPFLPDAPDERDSSHYITALAELMRRSRQRPYDEDVIWQSQAAYRTRKERA